MMCQKRIPCPAALHSYGVPEASPLTSSPTSSANPHFTCTLHQPNTNNLHPSERRSIYLPARVSWASHPSSSPPRPRLAHHARALCVARPPLQPQPWLPSPYSPLPPNSTSIQRIHHRKSQRMPHWRCRATSESRAYTQPQGGRSRRWYQAPHQAMATRQQTLKKLRCSSNASKSRSSHLRPTFRTMLRYGWHDRGNRRSNELIYVHTGLVDERYQ